MIRDSAEKATAQLEVHPPERVVRDGHEKNVAVISIHGMGQQTQNDTLASTADAVVQFIRAKSKGPALRTRVGEIELDGGARAMCAQITMSNVGGTQKRVHFFEVYWAPLTEGKISFLRTIWFLIVSAVFGAAQFALDGGQFRRWVLGRVQAYPVLLRTILAISFAALSIICLLCLYASFWFTIGYKLIALTLSAVHAVNDATIVTRGFDVVRAMDVLLMSFTYPALCVGIIGWIFSKVAGGAARSLTNSKVPFFVLRYMMLLFALPLLAIVIAAGATIALMVLDYGLVRGPGGAHIGLGSHVVDWLAQIIDRLDYSFYSWLAWGGMIADALVFITFHLFIKEFVGDVAIYVSAHRVDRFWNTRQEIRDVALKVANAVYRTRTDNMEKAAFAFEEVYFVAHSLGSVVAYDTLNGLIADEFAGKIQGVLKRTRMLLTYGSPLDKTAYLFRSYARDLGIRIGAAAASQPLIQGYRPFRWVNIYSRADIIGAPLNFYDEPNSVSSSKVENIEDVEGFVPFLAHTEYDQHSVFREVLYDALTR